MSYVRWSSDNWKSDVYCYEDVSGGFTTHVAGRRLVGLDTLPPDPDILDYHGRLEEWATKHKQHLDALGELPFEDIDLPSAGKSFNDETFDGMIERLRALRAEGLHVPDYLFSMSESDA